MSCIEFNTLSSIMTAIYYGKSLTNHVFITTNNIHSLVKDLPPILPVDLTEDIINTIKENNSTVEQYNLYIYANTNTSFDDWLYNMRKEGILNNPKYNSIYIGLEGEQMLLQYSEEEVNNVIKNREQELIDYLNSVKDYEEKEDWSLEEKLLYYKQRDINGIERHRNKLKEQQDLEALTNVKYGEKIC